MHLINCAVTKNDMKMNQNSIRDVSKTCMKDAAGTFVIKSPVHCPLSSFGIVWTSV